MAAGWPPQSNGAVLMTAGCPPLNCGRHPTGARCPPQFSGAVVAGIWGTPLDCGSALPYSTSSRRVAVAGPAATRRA